jgi:hypothetical protein
MPDDIAQPEPPDAHEVARELAVAITAAGYDYAIGGAIALGYCTPPRGTIDADVTIYIPQTQAQECVRLLQRIGCELDSQQTIQKLRDDGFCRVTYHDRTVDVFLPIVDFYQHARQRRQRVPMGETEVYIWDAETLCVFKMMFFRRKDLADVESILQSQRGNLDRAWIEARLIEMFGERNPRVSQWRELAGENLPS